MKKILFPIGGGVYPKVVGGMEIFNYYLIKSLSKDNKVSYMGIERYDYNGPQFIKLLQLKPSKIFYPLQVLINLLIKRKVDTIVYSYSSAHWIIWYLFYKIATSLNIPYIVVIHYGKNPPDENYECYKKFFSKARKVVAVSKDIKINFDNKYGIDSEVIYPLIPFGKSSLSKDSIREKYKIPLQANVVCMVGSIKKMKNPDTILNAISMMSKDEVEILNPYIIYAGKGDMIDELKRKADDCGLKDRICFLGFVPKENVNEVMKMSDIYLIASDFEGTSISLLEAMYNGLPVIASEVAGIKDTIGKEECIMYPVRDACKLKEALCRILIDKALRNKLSKSAQQRYITNYSYKNMINQYHNIL